MTKFGTGISISLAAAVLAGCGIDTTETGDSNEGTTSVAQEKLTVADRQTMIDTKWRQNTWLGTTVLQSNFNLTPPGGFAQYHNASTNPFTGNIFVSDALKAAHIVYGAIGQHYMSLGAQASALGYPTTDELDLSNSLGRYNAFQNGTIYWSPATGAWEVHGSIMNRYSWLGYERSNLGLPVSDQKSGYGGTWNKFEHGAIFYNGSIGPRAAYSTFPVMFDGYVSPYNGNNPTLDFTLHQNANGWDLKASGSGWPPGHQLMVWHSYPGMQTNAWGGYGPTVLPNGTFSLDTTGHTYLPLDSCRTVNHYITVVFVDTNNWNTTAVRSKLLAACPHDVSSTSL